MVLRAILARRLYYNSVYLHNWWNYISKLERGVCKAKTKKAESLMKISSLQAYARYVYVQPSRLLILSLNYLLQVDLIRAIEPAVISFQRESFISGQIAPSVWWSLTWPRLILIQTRSNLSAYTLQEMGCTAIYHSAVLIIASSFHSAPITSIIKRVPF